MNVKRMLIMSGACGVLASSISAALAQERNEVAEVVIVTGSYIRGTPEDAALPVDVISSDELEKLGSPSTLELIKSLSVSSGVLGDTNQFDSRAQGSEGSGTINVAAAADVGEAQGNVEAAIEGEAVQISFNARYLQEALQSLDQDQLALEFAGPLSPGVLKPTDDEEYVHVIMPVRTPS